MSFMSASADTVRFIHTADLHLGSPLRMIGKPAGELRTRLHDVTYEAFRRVVAAALEHDVDFVVISGDVYDAEARSVRANQFVVEQLQRLGEAGIPTYIIYGNHDPVGERTELLELPQQATVFGPDEVETALVGPRDDPTARILGQSYRNRAESRTMYQSFMPPDDVVPNVALLHTALDRRSRRYVPCSAEDLLSKSDLHYWALGHLHSPTIIHSENPVIAYPGTPQGRHVGETGLKGCLLVDLAAGGAAELRFIPTSEVVWLDEVVEVQPGTGETPQNLDDLFELMAARAAEVNELGAADWEPDIPVPLLGGSDLPTGYVVRWTVTGQCHLERLVDDPREAEAYLAARLREQFARGSRFLWTAGVRLRLTEPLSDLESAAAGDPVVLELQALLAEARQDRHFNRRLRSACGQLWYQRADHEEERDDGFALTKERFLELLAAAGEELKTQILRERMRSVD